jgi:uncharacterized membrane protein YeaQ/YmgE (transglycosylase-associated protein family)
MQSFLPPGFTKAADHVQSAVISFAIVSVVGSFIAMMLARTFGKSRAQSQAIFSAVSAIGVLIAAYVAMHVK